MIVVATCPDGKPCHLATAHNRQCLIECQIVQMVRSSTRLSAVKDRAAAGSKTHQEILDRAGINPVAPPGPK